MNTRILDNVNSDKTYITEDLCVKYEANYDYLDIDIIVFRERENGMKHMSYGINGVNYYDNNTSRSIQLNENEISINSNTVVTHYDNIQVKREKMDNTLVESITQDNVRREFLNIEGSHITIGKDFLLKFEALDVNNIGVDNLFVRETFNMPLVVIEALNEKPNEFDATGGIRIYNFKSPPNPTDRYKLFQYYDQFWKPTNTFMCVVDASNGICLNKAGDYGCQTGEFSTDLSNYQIDGTIKIFHPRIQSEGFLNITINNKLTIYKNFHIRLSEYAEMRDGEIEIVILQDNGHVYNSTEIPPILSVEFWVF